MSTKKKTNPIARFISNYSFIMIFLVILLAYLIINVVIPLVIGAIALIVAYVCCCGG